MTITVSINETLQRLLAQEDTDNDRRITVLDHGPKRFHLRSVSGEEYEVAGTYYLSNLLQELALAREAGQEKAALKMERIFEKPAGRLSRMIREHFWDGLTRRIDAEGLAQIARDEKADPTNPPRIYIPHDDQRAWQYFQEVARQGAVPHLEVVRLPERITPEYVRQINDRPGILCLALQEDESGKLRGVPFVVPGGRFNEMYGWDSYFEALGLLVDGRIDLARAMVDNFVYEIRHYGKILNANRSYYLTRSQPPFLTSMALAVFEHVPHTPENLAWLKEVFRIAIHEYHTVWMGPERLTETGLSRYHGSGLGMPPETEPGHFRAVLQPFARRHGLDVETFEQRYRRGEITEPELDAYFVHDRAVRESGHDTSYRLEGRCAHLNTVDLNSLLYKYEVDIAHVIEHYFGDALPGPDGTVERSDAWKARAHRRRELMNALMWDDRRGLFFDYDFVNKEQTGYESATTLYPLWAGLASAEQAEALVREALSRLEAPGGLVAGTEASRGPISETRPPRQWDYPFGWPPHQMLAWEGLRRYGYEEEARRLACRWLYMITRNAADFNGTVPEKYDVVERTHRVFVEYGNVGTEFAYITREGFGWMNASYQVGLQLITAVQRRELERLIPPEWRFGAAPVS